MAFVLEEKKRLFKTDIFSGGREATLFESDLKTSESSLLLKESGSILDVSISVAEPTVASFWILLIPICVNDAHNQQKFILSLLVPMFDK